MTSSVQSPADVVNLALRRLGYKKQIGSLFDGSQAANVALTIYGQTRDEVLRADDWGFAERNVSLALLKQAPVGGYFPPIVWTSAYPPIPWLYEYSYPIDCLKVRAIRGVPLILPNMDPKPVIFSVENDASLADPDKVILCNVSSAILTYTGRLTNPVDWEADFTEALAAALARRMAPDLVGLDAAKLEASDEQAAKTVADNTQG